MGLIDIIKNQHLPVDIPQLPRRCMADTTGGDISIARWWRVLKGNISTTCTPLSLPTPPGDGEEKAAIRGVTAYSMGKWQAASAFLIKTTLHR